MSVGVVEGLEVIRAGRSFMGINLAPLLGMGAGAVG